MSQTEQTNKAKTSTRIKEWFADLRQGHSYFLDDPIVASKRVDELPTNTTDNSNISDNDKQQYSYKREHWNALTGAEQWRLAKKGQINKEGTAEANLHGKIQAASSRLHL